MKQKLLIKTITVILLLAIAFNSFFYYVFFHFSLIYSRYQSHDWLTHAVRASLEMIKLPARNFDKEDMDDVWYNGEVYDVAGWKAVKDHHLCVGITGCAGTGAGIENGKSLHCFR